MQYYTYILQSKKDDGYYIGSTGNLEDRLERHNQGREKSTKSRIPFLLVYKEEFKTKSEAIVRERYLKSLKDKHIIAQLVRASR